MKNLYLLLNVTKDATPEEIKKAYKTLAMNNHPDKGGDADTMALLNEAYEVLSDLRKRKKYDADWSIFHDYEDFIPKGFFKAGYIPSNSQAYKIQHNDLINKYTQTPMEKNIGENLPVFKTDIYCQKEQNHRAVYFDDIFSYIRARQNSTSPNLILIREYLTIPIIIEIFKDFLSGLYFGENLKQIKIYLSSGLGSNGTANRLKAFLLFLMALTHHVLPHLAWQRNIVRAY